MIRAACGDRLHRSSFKRQCRRGLHIHGGRTNTSAIITSQAVARRCHLNIARRKSISCIFNMALIEPCCLSHADFLNHPLAELLASWSVLPEILVRIVQSLPPPWPPPMIRHNHQSKQQRKEESEDAKNRRQEDLEPLVGWDRTSWPILLSAC